MTGDVQQHQIRVKFSHADLLDNRASDMPSALQQMSSCVTSQNTEGLALQSPALLSARNSPVVQFPEMEDAAMPLEVLDDRESPTQPEHSTNASGLKSSPGDTGFNPFEEEDDSHVSGFFDMTGVGGTTLRLIF